MPVEKPTPDRVSTGVPGLDEILHGGLLPQHACLVRGGPGAGKTILGTHFLHAGATQNEPTLLVSLSEPERGLRANAARLGLDLSGVTILDLSPTSDFFVEAQSYDIFAPSEVEGAPTRQRIMEQVRDLQPTRVFVDALTQLHYFSRDDFDFRKQVLSLMRFLAEQGATVLFCSEASSLAPDDDLQFLSDGIIELSAGVDGRAVEIRKMRGTAFQPGRHTLRLDGRGMRVFPRLVPREHHREFTPEMIPSGVPALDSLLGGGLERGLATMITGPVGVGKTTMGLQFMRAAAQRGERSVIYTFDEAVETLTYRSEQVGIPVFGMVEAGQLAVVRVEPLTITADEFAGRIREEVEARGARVLMLDGIASYRLALQGQDLETHLHALTRYLRNMGVAFLLVNETETITGDFRPTEQGISHLADNVLFMRYVEMAGALQKVVGVLKKRASDFEKTLRQIEIGEAGVQVGPPLKGVHGILRGTPEWVARREDADLG